MELSIHFIIEKLFARDRAIVPQLRAGSRTGWTKGLHAVWLKSYVGQLTSMFLKKPKSH